MIREESVPRSPGFAGAGDPARARALGLRAARSGRCTRGNLKTGLAWSLVAVRRLSSLPACSWSTPTRGACSSSSAPTWARSRTPGLRWANPFYTKRRISLRVRNFESGAPEGQRHRRQPDRDRGRRGLAGGGHRRGRLRGGRLRELRASPERGGPAQPGHALPLRRARGGPDLAARQHGRGGRATCSSEIQERLAKAGVEVHRGAHQPPGLRARRSPRPCCAASRPARSSPRARRSSRARSAWWTWRWSCWPRATWSSSTRSARRPWSATCSWCCAATARPSRSSTPGTLYQ